MSNVKARIGKLEKDLSKKAVADRPVLPIMGGYPDKPHRDLSKEEIELLVANNLPVPICVQADFDINNYLSL